VKWPDKEITVGLPPDIDFIGSYLKKEKVRPIKKAVPKHPLIHTARMIEK